MTVTNVQKDLDAHTMTVTCAYDAPIERVWELWADPRKLERWWGPPTYPATFVEHDFTPGGRASYFMTGPEGDRHHGWWEFLSIDPPHGLHVRDGFADESGSHNDDLPVSTFHVKLVEGPAGRTTMTITSAFASRESMQQLLEMGMEQGLSAALGQIDALLAA
jgi:uncharacterized protein YndB with AHSA1/START domain